MDDKRRQSLGQPTTPPPLQPAPSPRYNDFTRPQSFQWNDRTQGLAGEGDVGLSAGDLNSGHGRRMVDIQSDVHSPWQGSITLPESDDEIINTAQTWISKVLHESADDSITELECLPESLTDGRILCRLAKCIEPGSVKMIHDDNSKKSQSLNITSFLDACQSFGVPKGAYFDPNKRDLKDVALCLHIVSRIIQDTVPSFTGPFIPCILSTSTSTTSSDETTATKLRRSGDDLLSLFMPLSEKDGKQTVPYSEAVQQSWVPLDRSPSLHLSPATQKKILPEYPQLPSVVGPVTNTAASSSEHSIQQQQSLKLPSHGSGSHQNAPWDRTFGSTVLLNAGDTTPVTLSSPLPWNTLRLGKTADDTSPIRQQQSITPENTAAAGKISAWLSNLNLHAFEASLVEIGVETMGDLRYVEHQDLAGIGMYGPQIRKFMENRPQL